MIENKKIIVIITARAGSKGIPQKNVRKLLDLPLFWWSVEAALNSKYVDCIVISSNCEYCKKEYNEFKELAEFSKEELNVEWVQRPDEISGDLSKNEEALIHTIETLEEKFDIIVNLQPTSPCRLFGLLDKCLIEYHEGGYDSLLTGTKDTPFLWRKKNGKWTYPVDYNDCCDRKMRQEFKDDDMDSEMTLHDNGNLYITESRILLDRKCRIGYNPCVFETNDVNCLQIDREFDFDLIEKMAELRSLDSLI